MITDEDKAWLRDEDEQFIFQYSEDGRYYVLNEHPDFENFDLEYDDELDVYFVTVEFHDFEQFVKLLGFEEYDTFVG